MISCHSPVGLTSQVISYQDTATLPAERDPENKALERSVSLGLVGPLQPGVARTYQARYQQHSATEQDGERITGCHAKAPRSVGERS